MGFTSVLLLVAGWWFRGEIESAINSLLALIATPTPTLSTAITSSVQPSSTISTNSTTVIPGTPIAMNTLTPSPSATASVLPSRTITPITTSPPSETSSVQDPTMTPDQPLRSGDVLTATYLDVQPIIDGDLEEWDLPDHHISRVVYGPGRYQNADDLSANLMISWDENHLYLGIHVIDDQYSQNATGDQIFRGDHIEVLLDTDLGGDFSSNKLDSDDYQLGLSLGRNLESPTNYLWYPKSIGGRKPSILLAGNFIEDGYILEAAIPFQVFQVFPEVGKYYGFAISVSDNDQLSENIQETLISTAINRKLSDPSTWGNLVLIR